MSETERLTVGAVLTILLFLVPAAFLHTAPRFAGSLSGFVLGVAAATLMMSLLIYPLAKYSISIRPRITRIASTTRATRLSCLCRSVRRLSGYSAHGPQIPEPARDRSGDQHARRRGDRVRRAVLPATDVGPSCGKIKLSWQRCGPFTIVRPLLLQSRNRLKMERYPSARPHYREFRFYNLSTALPISNTPLVPVKR